MRRVVVLTILLIAACHTQEYRVPTLVNGRAVEFRFAETTPFSGALEATNPTDGTALFLENTVIIGDESIASAKAVKLKDGSGAVEIFLSAGGRTRMAEVSRENVGRVVAILVSGKVIAAVPIRSELNLPSFVLVASFTNEEAEDLAHYLSRPRT